MALIAPASAGAVNVPASFDALETDPQDTYVDFAPPNTVIPPGFFDPGSDPFTGRVYFGGVPLQSFNPPPPGGPTYNLGDTDTIVERQGAANLPGPFPQSQAVPIELVALQLRSVEPITVTYGAGSPERWQVDVAKQPAPASTGTINITAQSNLGGTFSSQLNVLALLTFTRISDGAVRTLAPPQPFQFFASNVKWRAGCIAPALKRSGFNDGFCPGLTGNGIKVRATHQANNPSQAHHSVYPAQEALEHFKCYTLQNAPFPTPTVKLFDQFQTRNHQIIGRGELCNPARKNNEPWINRNAHLQCYRIDGAPLNQIRPVHNQFGAQRLLVKQPQRLCAIAQKRLTGPPTRRGVLPPFPPISPAFTIDHFKCYGVQPASPLEKPPPAITQVNLEDQFHLETGVPIGPPVRLCTPVKKLHNTQVTPIRHPVQHLVCYSFPLQPLHQVDIEILNQFEQAPLRTIRPVQLCVPSVKGLP